MANRGSYDSFPEGSDVHDKLLVETQMNLLNRIKDAPGHNQAAKYAEAYALISGLAVVQPELKNN